MDILPSKFVISTRKSVALTRTENAWCISCQHDKSVFSCDIEIKSHVYIILLMHVVGSSLVLYVYSCNLLLVTFGCIEA